MRDRLSGMLAALAVASHVHAQAPNRPAAIAWPRQTLGMETGLGSSLIGALGGSCGFNPTIGIAATASRRLLGIIVLEGAVGAHGTVDIGECDHTVGAPNGSDSTFRPTGVDRGRNPSDGVLTTIVRAGLETPPLPGWRLRATAGAGRMWGAGVPFWTARVVSVAGTGDYRLVLGAERWWYGLTVTGLTAPPGFTLPIAIVHERQRTQASFLRLGVEWTVGRRR